MCLSAYEYGHILAALRCGLILAKSSPQHAKKIKYAIRLLEAQDAACFAAPPGRSAEEEMKKYGCD